MLQLCGIPLSNYYNKVKFVLLEHDIPFEESVCGLPISDPAQLADSPLGKIPFLKTEEGALFESQVIVEYLAARYPEKVFCPQARSRPRRCANWSRRSSCISNGWRARSIRKRFSAARSATG